MTIFDDDGHAVLADFETLCAAAQEVCADPKWFGGTIALQTVDGVVECKLSLNPANDSGLQKVATSVGDHLVKWPLLGFVVSRPASECPICEAGE